MPSSFSASLRFELQFTGENINLWGEKLNAALQRVDSAIAGWANVSLNGLAAYSLTTANGSADEARSAMLKFTGTPLSPPTVTIPVGSKRYDVWNATDKAVTITTGSGATVTVDSGDIVAVICDGTNVKAPGYSGLTIKEYIAAQVISGSGSVPAVAGNAGKFVYTDGSLAYWKTVMTTDLGDYQSEIIGKQVALAVAL